jgi:predicted DNA-binding ribbon-helix-helix protein
MKSSVVKRTIAVGRRRTAVSLEDAFWDALKAIADKHSMTPSQLVTTIDTDREHANLSSAIRLFVLGVYRGEVSAAAPLRDRVARSENG